jgi:predicted metal-dependent enzyme (double-stranded beta helix superfamily)
MKTLQNLAEAIAEQFAQAQTLSSIEVLKPLVANYVGEDWRNYITLSAEGYTRNYVFRSADFEIIVLCWQFEQGSPIHNHADRGCLLKVLEGTLSEERFLEDGEQITQNYAVGSITYIDNLIGLHRIRNNFSPTAISLHIYSPGFFIPQMANSLAEFEKNMETFS